MVNSRLDEFNYSREIKSLTVFETNQTDHSTTALDLQFHPSEIDKQLPPARPASANRYSSLPPEVGPVFCKTCRTRVQLTIARNSLPSQNAQLVSHLQSDQKFVPAPVSTVRYDCHTIPRKCLTVSVTDCSDRETVVCKYLTEQVELLELLPQLPTVGHARPTAVASNAQAQT